MEDAKLEAPVCHHTPADATVPLIWVDGTGPSSGEELGRRVAAHIAGAPETAPQEEVHSPAGAFGARQRRWLTRLTWRPSERSKRVLVRRTRFIDPMVLASMASEPPEDAIVLPALCDGLVDGLTAAGDTAFYLVLEGPAPWTPVSISPLLPPFTEAARPLLLGAVEERLLEMASAFDAGTLDATARELVDASLRVIDDAGVR